MILLAAGALALGTIHAAPALAQHEHQDLAIGADAIGGGNLLLDYPFDERPVVPPATPASTPPATSRTRASSRCPPAPRSASKWSPSTRWCR
jgi:hypothetical protein